MHSYYSWTRALCSFPALWHNTLLQTICKHSAIHFLFLSFLFFKNVFKSIYCKIILSSSSQTIVDRVTLQCFTDILYNALSRHFSYEFLVSPYLYFDEILNSNICNIYIVCLCCMLIVRQQRKFFFFSISYTNINRMQIKIERKQNRAQSIDVRLCLFVHSKWIFLNVPFCCSVKFKSHCVFLLLNLVLHKWNEWRKNILVNCISNCWYYPLTKTLT